MLLLLNLNFLLFETDRSFRGKLPSDNRNFIAELPQFSLEHRGIPDCTQEGHYWRKSTCYCGHLRRYWWHWKLGPGPKILSENEHIHQMGRSMVLEEITICDDTSEWKQKYQESEMSEWFLEDIVTNVCTYRRIAIQSKGKKYEKKKNQILFFILKDLTLAITSITHFVQDLCYAAK